MDPYRTLGVPRGCSREAVKEAFRAKVPLAHPDRGGEDVTFIELRAAYERILRELDRRPRPRPDIDRRARPRCEEVATKPLATSRDLIPLEHDEPSDEKRTPDFPDPVIARKDYISWIQRVSSAGARRRKRRSRWKWARNLGMTFLLYMIFWYPVAGLWYIVVGTLGLESAARRAWWDPTLRETLNSVWVAVVTVLPLLAACRVMWKYDFD